MTIFVPYENPDVQSDQNLICLPDRFSWFAFFLPPIWALRHRLWLIFAAMVVALITLMALGKIFILPGFAIYMLFALWLGFEAGSLRGRKLVSAGWQEKRQLPAPTLLQAETKYFSRARRMKYRQIREAQTNP